MFTGDTKIDLHGHVVCARHQRRAYAINPSAMLEGSRMVKVSGHDVPTFDPVDTLLHLGLHAARAGADRDRVIAWQSISGTYGTTAGRFSIPGGRCVTPITSASESVFAVGRPSRTAAVW